jgi:hypothetical protein
VFPVKYELDFISKKTAFFKLLYACRLIVRTVTQMVVTGERADYGNK